MSQGRTPFGILTAIVLVIAGIQMLGIRSIADTVAEAFHNAFGVLAFGLAEIALLVASIPAPEARTDPRRFKRCTEYNEVIHKVATRCPRCTTDLVAAEREDRALRARDDEGPA